jgi:hypothetical protein
MFVSKARHVKELKKPGMLSGLLRVEAVFLLEAGD